MFADLAEPPLDPILGLAQLLAQDKSPDKVDLGIGIYQNEHGEAPVLDCVKAAERWLAETQPSKRYLSSAGNADYNTHTRGLLFGEGSDGFARSRTRRAARARCGSRPTCCASCGPRGVCSFRGRPGPTIPASSRRAGMRSSSIPITIWPQARCASTR